ncbi:aldose 1-epimerase family protein [Paratractidigestivibacter sp.]|uniref:aldose 1-epimerase family protein n=1 Tax=Paratractidigestivibacter sp. TaxID=2847316 RepID=UPI002AC8FAE4|nr:aldose 1-epimerase family protein [Paratractidigestivibacter sp.]
MDVTISDNKLSVGLTSAGGSFTSLKLGGTEYLWQPDAAVWSGQAPICFPICGGLRDGRATTASGKKVELARHGFARKSEFALVASDETSATYRLESNPETLKQYPFPFRLDATYKVVGGKLTVSYAVTNTGDEDMPFFIGGHPGFACPVMEGESYDDYLIRFEKPETSTLCRAVPSTGLIDVGTREDSPTAGTGELPLTHELFDFAEKIYDALESRSATLVNRADDRGVRLEFADFDYLIVWSKPAGDFVAIEPWGGLSTCSDEDDVLEHKRGCIVAAPGQTVERSFTIEPF